MPSSSLIFSIVPQARSYCARFLDRIRRPSLSSFWRTRASISSPTPTTSEGSTSCLMESSREGMTPSVLYPMSSRTSSRSTLTMVPETMSPSLKYLIVSSMAAMKSSARADVVDGDLRGGARRGGAGGHVGRAPLRAGGLDDAPSGCTVVRTRLNSRTRCAHARAYRPCEEGVKDGRRAAARGAPRGVPAGRAGHRPWPPTAGSGTTTPRGTCCEHGDFLGGGPTATWCGARRACARPRRGLLGDVTGRHVLEVGCGGAQCARWLAARGARVVGFDLSAGMLRRRRSTADRVAVPGAGRRHPAPVRRRRVRPRLLGLRRGAVRRRPRAGDARGGAGPASRRAVGVLGDPPGALGLPGRPGPRRA